MINKHPNAIGKRLESSLSNYDNVLIIGDCNSEITKSSMHEFWSLYNLNSFCNERTCYKNPEKLFMDFIFYLQAPQDPSKIPEQLKLVRLTSIDVQ